MLFTLHHQLGSYVDMTGDILHGGGAVRLPGKDHCSDVALCPEDVPCEDYVLQRYISELEVTPRREPEIERLVSTLFAGIPVLQCVSVHKVLSPHAKDL
jgi:hypothetical protein